VGRPTIPARDVTRTLCGALGDRGPACASTFFFRTVVGIHIGTSGWSYDHWDGILYPPGTPPGERLQHYRGRFDTVELNSSFYHWPRAAMFVDWRRRLPEGFRFR
jgi:hypothetical protein